MQPHSPSCSNCDDTGSSEKTLHGDLDCTHCSAPAERMKLRQYLAELTVERLELEGESLAWHCYLKGVQSQQQDQEIMALNLRRMWGWAIQIGEQFNPASDTERADWRRQCDEAMMLLREYPPQQQSQLEE